MSDSVLRELLSTPLEPEPPERRWPWVLVALAAVVGATVSAVALFGSGTAEPSATTTDVDSAPTAAQSPTLREVFLDPPYLFLPTLLPAGMNLCEPPGGLAARFCGTDDIVLTFQLQEVQSTAAAESGVPVADWPSARWVRLGDTPTLAITLDDVARLIVAGTGLPDDTVIEVARSVPLVESGFFELDTADSLRWADVTDALAASILGIEESDVYQGGFGWVPRTNVDNVRLFVAPESPTLEAHAASMRWALPNHDFGVPAVMGMGRGSRESAHRFVWWQRGFVWTLETERSAEVLLDMAASAVEIIRDL